MIGGQFGTATNLAPESIWHRTNLTPRVQKSQFDTKSVKESIWHQECKRDNLGVINFDCCLWALSGPEGGRAQLLKMCIQFNILDPILICVPNIWGSYQLWLLSLGPIGPWGREGTISKNVYTIQSSWSYPDLCAKHLGVLSTLIVVFGPCRALRGGEGGTISKNVYNVHNTP